MSYERTWQQAFDPLAARIRLERRAVVELAVLPFANGGAYESLRDALLEEPAELDRAGIAQSAVLSLAAVPGRGAIATLEIARK